MYLFVTNNEAKRYCRIMWNYSLPRSPVETHNLQTLRSF